LIEKNALYRCLDKLLEHKTALFDHLRQRWQDLFGASFEVLLQRCELSAARPSISGPAVCDRGPPIRDFFQNAESDIGNS